MSALEQSVPEEYQKTEIGIIPKSWESMHLGDLAEIRMCKRILAWQTSKSGKIPFFKIGTFGGNPDAFIPSNLYNEFKKKFSFPEKGDVLISAAGTIGKTVVYDGEDAYFQDSNIVWLEIDKTKILNEYLYHYYKVIKWASTEGSTISRLYNGIIKASPIALPSLKEQTAIANALSDVDALLTELENLIAKKQAIKTATMQQLLTGKTRLPQFATYTKGEKQGQPKGTKPSELSEIPEDWDVAPLQKLTVMMTNGFVGTAKSHYTDRDDGVTYIQGYNVLENSFNFRGIKKVTKEFHQRQSKSNLRTGDVLMVQTGDVGLTTIVPESLAGSNCHALIISRFKRKLFDPMFFSYYLNSQEGRARLKDIEIGTTMKHINVGDLLHFEVPVPSEIEEQTAIATILSDMDNEIQTLEQRLANTRQIKQGMMQELLTGRTRLPFDKE